MEDTNGSKTRIIKPETIGEELYLVHLRRGAATERREEDYDQLTPRKRLHDVGEELWEVHLKRSRGQEPDVDVDHDDNKKVEEGAATSPPKDEPQKEEGRYNLRSKGTKK